MVKAFSITGDLYLPEHHSYYRSVIWKMLLDGQYQDIGFLLQRHFPAINSTTDQYYRGHRVGKVKITVECIDEAAETSGNQSLSEKKLSPGRESPLSGKVPDVL